MLCRHPRGPGDNRERGSPRLAVDVFVASEGSDTLKASIGLGTPGVSQVVTLDAASASAVTARSDLTTALNDFDAALKSAILADAAASASEYVSDALLDLKIELDVVEGAASTEASALATAATTASGVVITRQSQASIRASAAQPPATSHETPHSDSDLDQIGGLVIVVVLAQLCSATPRPRDRRGRQHQDP